MFILNEIKSILIIFKPVYQKMCHKNSKAECTIINEGVADISTAQNAFRYQILCRNSGQRRSFLNFPYFQQAESIIKMPLKELSHEEQSHLFIQGRICKRQPAKVTLKDRGR